MDEIKDTSKTDGVVTIEMAAEEINAATKVDEPQAPEPSTDNPQTEQPQKEELSTETKQEIVVEKTNPDTGENEETMRLKIKPEEEVVEKKREANRPCTFCEDRTKIMQKVHLYREYCEGKVDGKPHIPYLQELCGYDYLDMLTTTLWGWVNNERHEAEHQELTNTIKKLLERQQLRLLQRTLGVHNPSGAIFQLKANHGMIETEKQILAGQSGEPLEYNIHIVPKTQKQIEQQDE